MVQESTTAQYYYGTGKRKTAIAKVRLYPNSQPAEAGLGEQVQVNGKPVDEFFPWAPWRSVIQEPFKATELVGSFGVVAQVQGGGVSAQAQAIRHGISRALAVYDETLKTALRSKGLLTRDARIKESKKYGLKRARRAPQYTKR